MSGITVSGRGEAFGTPDTMTVMISVVVTRPDASEAGEVGGSKASAVLAALTAEGVGGSDVRTTNYTIGPQYDYRGETPRLTGYQADSSVSATVRDLDRAGPILEAVVGAGDNDVRVSGVRFAVSDKEALLVAARRAAWDDAQAKADQLATLAGIQLGAPVSITESLDTPQPVMRARALAAADTSPPIEPGQQTVSVAISVTFAIRIVTSST